MAQGEGRSRAAQYLRMSTEHQNYSIANQRHAIAGYAEANGLEIVATYLDEGASGLGAKRRHGLQSLFRDVLGGESGFEVVLVYDVSRWGRFQDPDQSAHYEFLCRQTGVRVEYVAETFVNDGTITATLAKSLKRVMAAEYSRELSARVSAAKRRLAGEGFWVGGPAGYGLRRRIVSMKGELGPTLAPGQHKALQSDRVILVAGPPEEQAVVRRIFRMFVVGGMSRTEVSRVLNREGVPAAEGHHWSAQRVHEVLTNEKYLGVRVFGRRVGRLGAPVRWQPRDSWVTTPGAGPALIDRDFFDLAQSHIGARNRHLDDGRLLQLLQALLAEKGALSADIIAAAHGVPCPDVYRKRFGGLIGAYHRIGYGPTARQTEAAERARRLRPSQYRRPPRPQPSDAALVADLVRLRQRHGRLTVQLINEAPDMWHSEVYRRQLGGMRRAYALAGYTPDPFQETVLERHRGQTVTTSEAAVLRMAAAADSRPTG